MIVNGVTGTPDMPPMIACWAWPADKKFCSEKTTTLRQVLPEKMTMADKTWTVIIVFDFCGGPCVWWRVLFCCAEKNLFLYIIIKFIYLYFYFILSQASLIFSFDPYFIGLISNYPPRICHILYTHILLIKLYLSVQNYLYSDEIFF